MIGDSVSEGTGGLVIGVYHSHDWTDRESNNGRHVKIQVKHNSNYFEKCREL